MTGFTFAVDTQSREFLESIIERMLLLFGIDRQEAIGRINRIWARMDFLGSDDIRYHEDDDYWARTIYFGKDSMWWLNPPDLKPLPYP
jgi:hypothetical protein